MIYSWFTSLRFVPTVPDHPPVTPLWKTIDTVPRDGKPFLTINHDGEIWLAKYEIGAGSPRLCFRTNSRREPRSYIVHKVDGKKLLEPTNGSEADTWDSCWTIWTRLYEFVPTHWMALPPPPVSDGANTSTAGTEQAQRSVVSKEEISA